MEQNQLNWIANFIWGIADDVLRDLYMCGKQVATHLYGQEINAETYAICKADLLLKGEGEAADNIIGGPEHSTLSNDFYKPQPLRTLEEIRADILALERETEGLLDEIIGGGKA